MRPLFTRLLNNASPPSHKRSRWYIFSWSGERNAISSRNTSEDRHISIDVSDLRCLFVARRLIGIFLQRNLELFRRCILAAAAQVSSHGGCFISRPSAGVQAETWARVCWRAHGVLKDLRLNRESQVSREGVCCF